jgi:hypothetical protein
MRGIVKNYIKMLRAGFFLKSMFMPLILILPAIVAALGLRSDVFGLFLIVMGGFTVQQIVISEVSEKRYILFSSLPIEIKEVIKIGYIHTYLIYMVSFICTLSIVVLTGGELPLLSLICFVMFGLLANIFYPFFASIELKLGVNHQQDRGAIWAVVILTIMIFLGGVGFTVIHFIDSNILYYGELSVLIILTIISIATVRKSYKTTISKVMGFKV